MGKQTIRLTPDPKNANRGTERGRGMLEQSLRSYGAGRSILADKNGLVIARNKTLEVAAELGLPIREIVTDGKELVVVRRRDLDLVKDKAAKELAIADNRVGEINLDWDAEVLRALSEEIDIGKFFSEEDLDELIASASEDEEEIGEDAGPQLDKAEELRKKWRVETGQLWQLGEHRLLCGDSTKREDVERAMGREKADATVTDPPYGVGIDYGSFEDTEANVRELISKLMPILLECPVVVMTPGIPSMWFYPRPTWLLAWIHPAPVGGCPWGFGGLNPILAHGGDPYLARGLGRRPDHIVLATDREGVDGHPTPKPLKVWEWLVERVSPEESAVIFDPFSGSGTTLIACERLNRKCRAIEISPAYVAVALQRWADLTGKTPKLL